MVRRSRSVAMVPATIAGARTMTAISCSVAKVPKNAGAQGGHAVDVVGRRPGELPRRFVRLVDHPQGEQQHQPVQRADDEVPCPPGTGQ